MILFIGNTATYGPYRIAFIDKEHPVMNGIDITMDIFFIIDIIITFFTDYLDTKTSQKVTSLKLIAKNYVTSSFIFDLVAAIPFSIIDSQNP
jgi:hypothetical protein